MPTIREKSSTVQFFTGIVLAGAGVALVGCGAWDLLQVESPMFLYAMGFLLFAVGIFVIWKEPPSALVVEDEPMMVSATGKCAFLGRIDLNGIYFEAYEELTDKGGKRFRLQTLRPIGPEREAAFIRYLIHEGFIEKRWPHLSEKIQKEAGWAFLF